MPSLILEGGTFRTIFNVGVMDALLDNNIIFPYCIGVSAGAANGVSYISKQKGRNLEIIEKYRNDKRYLGATNFIKEKSLFGLNFIFSEIPNNLIPFDMNTFKNYTGTYLVGVTNADTGEIEYLNGKDLDKDSTMLRATCAIPLFFPAIKVNGKNYYDGGICDPIPIRKAILDGNQKHLIVLTRPKGYIKTLDKRNILANKILSKKYPNLTKHFLDRHTKYNATVKFCESLEAEGKAVILRPTFEGAIESFEKDTSKLKAGYDLGYKIATDNIDKIKSLFS